MNTRYYLFLLHNYRYKITTLLGSKRVCELIFSEKKKSKVLIWGGRERVAFRVLNNK